MRCSVIPRSTRFFLLVLAVTLVPLALEGTAMAQSFSLEEGVLRVATEDWPPYAYSENGVMAGYSVEILNAVFGGMGVKAVMNQYPWARAQKMALDGEADALFNASFKQERADQCYYPVEALTTCRYVLFIRAKDAGTLRFSSLEDLMGHKVGVTRGYSYSTEFLDFLRERGLMAEANKDEVGFQLLAGGRIDFFPADSRNGIFLLKKMNLKDQIVALEKPITEKEYFIIFNRRNVDRSFVDRFDAALREFKKTKQFQEIEDKYLR